MKRFAKIMAVLLMLGASTVSAQGKDELAQRILDEVAAGRNAAVFVKQFRDTHASGASPAPDRAAEIRQLREAEQALADALRTLQSSSSREHAAKHAVAAYQQWKAAVLIFESHQQSIEKKLTNSEAGSGYLKRHQDVARNHNTRHQQIRQLLEPWLDADPDVQAAKSGKAKAAPDLKTVASAIALLTPNHDKTGQEPVLHATNLPVGELNLPARSPKTTPEIVPSYANASEVAATADDTAESSEAPLSEEIIQHAKSLGNDYVRIYEFVRNQNRTEWYSGSVKGALGTLRSGAGNDVDQASLLIALLRAAGVPSRYVHGVVELSVEKAANDLGVPDTSLVPGALTKAGIAFTPVARGGRIAAVQVEHTWVAAQVPYTNYRGAVVDASGRTWIPLDPSHKESKWIAPQAGLSDVGTAASLQNDYLSQVRTQSFGDFLKKQVTDALQARTGAEVNYLSQLGRQDIASLNLSLLPNSLPYPVVAVTYEGARLADADRLQARVVIRAGTVAGGPEVLDVTLALHEITNQRFTISYIPASLEDHRLTLAFGGLDAIPLYLIQLRPQIKIGGKVRAIAKESIAPGSDLTLDIALSGAFGSQRITHTVTAGAYQALVLAGTSISRPVAADPADSESQAARLLDGIGIAYQQAWTAGESDIAALTSVRTVRPLPSLAIITNHMVTESIGDTPHTLVWKGVTLHAASHPLAAIGSNVKDFLSLSGLHGSSLEYTIFQNQFGVNALSADKGMALVKNQEKEVLKLNAANVASLDVTDHATAVKDHIKNLARLGYRVETPASRLNYEAWTGSVWRAVDDATGASGYFISGGLAGGTTADASTAWTLDFLAEALRSPNSEPYNSDPLSGVEIYKLGGGDGQTGTVGQPLSKPLSVMVIDKEGKPVKGAAVTFRSTAGGGTFGAGGSSITVTTSALGIASVVPTLGTKTGDNPLYVMRNPGDAAATRVGWHLFDASAPGAQGDLLIDTPFTAIANPGELAGLRRASKEVTEGGAAQWADNLSVVAEDKFGNPLPNVNIAFSISTEMVCNSDNAATYFQQGAVFDSILNPDGTTRGCSVKLPALGDCGNPSMTTRTESDGNASAGVILGNDVMGDNTVTVQGGAHTLSLKYKAWGNCGDRYTTPVYYGYVYGGGTLVDENGANVSGAQPGTPYQYPITAKVMRSEWPYEVRNVGGQNKLYFDPFVKMVSSNGTVNFSVSGGGSASGAESTGVGSYKTHVTVGAAPGANEVTATASNIEVDVPKIDNGVLNLEKQFVNVSAKVATVYAVRPQVDNIVPAGDAAASVGRIDLDANDRTVAQLEMQYRIAPDEYTALNVDVDLYENGEWSNYVTGNNRKSAGAAILPRGIKLDLQKSYEAEVVLNRGSLVEMRSDRFPLSTKQKLIRYVNDRRAGAQSEIDLLNKRACERPGYLGFGFTQDVVATLRVELLDPVGAPLGSPRELFSNQFYPRGDHGYNVEAAVLGTGKFRYTLAVTSAVDPAQKEEAKGEMSTLFQQVNRLPVGQVLVKGVNVKNGNLTAQTQAIALPGRGPALRFQPTYSSGANGQISTMGANWTHNFDSGLHINSCGEVIVSAGDSGSVRFFPGNDGKLVADKGHHATLEKNDSDRSFDFFSKDGTRHHYKFINERVRWKLDLIEDTNGNALQLNYDLDAIPEPRLVSVRDSAGRTLNFTYAEVRMKAPIPGEFSGRRPFLQTVNGPGGLSMHFTHDEYGNLTQVDRNGRLERFTYSVDDLDSSARHLIKTHVDPNGNTTTYTFNQKTVEFTPENSGSKIVLPNSLVTTIKTPTGTVAFQIDTDTFKSTTVTDENGNATSYTLNDYGSPLSITDPAGTTAMEWSADDITLLSKTNARGVKTSFTYDSHANLLSESTAGATTSTTYLVQPSRPYIKNRVTSRTDGNDNTTRYALDSKGNVLTESLPEGVTIAHSYSGNGDRLQTVEGNGGVIRFSHDAQGNLTAIVNPLGAATWMTRDARGRILTSTDGNGNTTAFAYDAQDRITSRTDPKGKSRIVTYDQNGNKLAETDEAGRKTAWQYNALNLPTAIVNADGNTRTIGYDKAGNKTEETDFRGNATAYTYDGVNRLVSRTEPLGKKTTYTYDPVGNLLSETDALGRTTRHSYDDLGRRTGTVDANGGAWTMSYDNNGNKTSSTDALGRTTTFSHDGLNRLTSVKEPLSRTTSSTYDKNGNKLTETNPNGHLTQYEYDDANRLLKMTDANGKATTHEYDKNNNLTRTIAPNLSTTLHSYDELNRKRDTKDGEGYVTRYEHDAVGNLIGETPPNGNRIVHAYDNLNRRVSTADDLGMVASWEYDADGNTLSERDGNGNTTSHTYNALSHLTASALPEGRAVSYESDLLGNRTRMTDARGNDTHDAYDALNRPVKRTDAMNGVTGTTYDKVGNILSETDQRGHTTSYTYDDLNRLIKTTDALGQSISLTYDAAGNKVTDTDKRGTVTRYAYDKLNRVTEVSKDGVVLVRNQYDDVGNLLFVTDAIGHTTGYEYDRRNLRIAENRLLAAITRFKLDAMGDVIETTDPEGRQTASSHDQRRRLVAVTNSAGETTRHSYDRANNRISTTLPKGNGTASTYDGANRLIAIKDGLGHETRYGYDHADNLVSFTDARGNATGYTYDALNRRTGLAYPGGAAESFGYDAAGNRTRHTDGNGITVSYTHDPLNRETAQSYSASADGITSVTTQYDENSNVVQVTQSGATAQISTYAYDSFDRPQRQTDPFGATATISYDPNGNKTSLITQDGKVTRYSYDALNRLTSIVGPSGSTSYRHDRSGLTTGIGHGNGVSTSTTYDAAGRVKTVVHAKGSANLSRTEYEYDKNGNRTREVINRTDGAQATTYIYDGADRLTQTEVIDTDKTVTTGYTLDAVANRTGETVSTTTGGSTATVSKTYTYDGRNRLTGITDPAAGDTTLSYDGAGNLVQKEQGSDVTLYGYNARDHLIRIAKNGTVLGSYGNDHRGLRIEKEAKDPLQPGALPVRVRTFWEGRHAFQDSDSSGAVVARYDSDGRHPVSMWSREDGSQALHHDALGSIVATTDSAGNLKSETIYDAWGNPVIETGSSANKFGYTGHQRDRDSGLIYFQARYYDPAIGRFLTRDPFEGDWNTPLSLHRYLYAYANPTVYIDLHGYESIFANIDKAAEGCGAWSCAGYALLKGTYAAATFGFAIVHDPVRDMYDDGKISGGQYAARGIGGGLAMVGVNVAGVAVGGVGSGATATVAGTMARGAATGAAIAGATDAATQGVNISAGLQERYEVERTVTAAVVGGALGAAAPAVAAGLNTQTGRAITGAVSSTVRKTAEAVESAAQSVGSRAKGVVTQEGSMLGTAGAPIRGKSVVAERAVDRAKSEFMGARGVYSTREFDPALAGGPLRQLSADNIKFTERGISVVEKHTARFGTDPANEYMIGRLRQIANGEIEATVVDRNFYSHELREYVRYRRVGWETGQPADPTAAYRLWNNAHTATLEEYRILGPNTDPHLYHLNAIKLMENN